MVRARVVESSREHGFGKIELEDGRQLPFDVSVSVLGVPDVGASVEVQLGKSRLGGDKVTRLEVLPWWEPMTFPFLFLRKIDAEAVDLIVLRDSGPRRAKEPLAKFQGGGELRPGVTGYLAEERKRGFDSALETRVVRFWCEDVPPSTRADMLEAFRTVVEEEWEEWDHPDGSHTRADRDAFACDVYLARDLGLDVDTLFHVRDYPEQEAATAYEDLRPEVDRWVRLSRPDRSGY